MDAYYELVDLASGNMIEDYDCERDAIEALTHIVQQHGSQAIGAFALSYVQDGRRRLVAMQDNLVLRVEQEMGQLVQHRRRS